MEHTKTMMTRKTNEEMEYKPRMDRVGRSRRKKCEGRGKKRCGVTRTNETRRVRGKIVTLEL